MGMLAPLVAFMVLFGIYPYPIVRLIDSATQTVLPRLADFTHATVMTAWLVPLLGRVF
jgi:NADH:ubiquinone oxidoreductase subunit 4 (subunit M)